MSTVTNSGGHEVKIKDLVSYHTDRLLEAIRFALTDEFAEVLAVEHAAAAVRAWRAK